MSDDPKRPIPAPRKRPGTQQHQVNAVPPGGFSPRPDLGQAPIRYTAPVTPSSHLSMSLGGSSTNVNPPPSYVHQTSTPLPYQPPVTPSSSQFRSSQKKEYSGPHKVITPQPMGSEGYGLTFTPRKDSWSSSRSSLSSDPSSPARMFSEDLAIEIDKQKEMKASLIEEVAQLNKQKDVLLSEIKEQKQEVEEHRAECEKYGTRLESLMNDENSVKLRIAQCEQNLQLMGRLSAGGDSEKEQKLKKREKELDDLEFSLNERDMRIRQRELEIQSEGDVLFQRRKELDLREYDLKNFQGPQQPLVGPARDGHSEILSHEERERDLQQKEQRLFQKEIDLNDLEAHLKKEQARLLDWEKRVQHEDERAQKNSERAKGMMQEAHKLMQEASDASKVAAMLDDERKGTNKPSIKDSSTASKFSGATTDGNYGATGGYHGAPVGSNITATSGAVSVVSANESDCSEDLLYARFINMEINAQLQEQDALIAKQMSSNPNPDFMDSDAELAFQQQLEILGIAPGSVDAEALKKQLQEQLDMQQKAKQVAARDEEIAASMRGSD